MKSIRTNETKMSLSAALTAAICLGAFGAACAPPPDDAGASGATSPDVSALRASTSGEPLIADDPATTTRPTRTATTKPLPPVTSAPPARPLPVDTFPVSPPILVAPIDPPPPSHPVCGKAVRISSEQLDMTLGTLLFGTNIAYDTTKTSPPLTGQVYGCSYPNHQALEAAIAECHQLPKSAWASCVKEAEETFTNDPVCGTHPAQFHSYIDFGPIAESQGAEDELFDTDTIIKDTSTGEATFDINFVHTTVNLGNMTSSFTNDAATGRANASLSLRLFSDDPTILCTYWIGCPDLELSDMRVEASLVGISPTEDKLQLGFDRSDVTFTFQKNINNIPDPLIDVFFDVESLIKSRVKNTLQGALNKTKTRVAVNKALTGLVKSFAPDKVQFFYDAWFENGSLVVDYQPTSSALAGTGCLSAYAF